MGSILRLDRTGQKTYSVNLITGSQRMQVTEMIPIYDYVPKKPSKRINSLVNCIYVTREKLEDGYPLTVFYLNCFNHAISCMNDSIINLLSSGINMYITRCGAIILWDSHDLYTTVDMQQLNFHSELDGLFKQYKIIDIYTATDNSGRDYITLCPLNSDEHINRELITVIDLSSNCSVKITFKD